jgi:ABC-type multidrug transport system ATPase subunit
MNIELQEILKKYQSVRALDDISLTIESGQVIALLGPNGSGKTTLLRSLAGTIGLDKGEIRYDGERFVRGRTDLRRRLFFLPDFPALFEEWSPLRHIGMVLHLYKANGTDLEARVMNLLCDFDLLPLASAPFFALSRGQRYKAALTALLTVNPELWLVDEPFASGMDPNGIDAFKRLSREAAVAGKTVIYSTQILDAAEHFSDRICVIHRGKIRAFEKTASIRQAATGDSSGLDELFKQLREEDNR